jgi:rfaE bifunctional protein kinase chain/domain/rfaE bifunctional protein nucleotidyltransferase chain/domain
MPQPHVSSKPGKKIVSLAQLLALRHEARAAGRAVVHCHGCFDIVHPGHIHHLQLAKSYGDLLVVSVSADSQVSKGVNRPLVPDDLRAESLAALECVDFVHVNPEPTAVDLLEQLRPDVYVKGKEYEHNRDPRFLAERETVTRHGGRVICSSGDVIFSSTALIGQMDAGDFLHQEKLRRLRERCHLHTASMHALIHRFRGQRVLVIGDYILDRYHFCEATGIAGESPMMSLRSLETKDYDGGAAVIALHLAGLGANPTLLTTLADHAAGPERQRLAAAGVDVLAHPRGRANVCKHRYLVDQTKMMKVDEGQAASLDSRSEKTLADWILDAADGAAAVIFADFGYGTLTGGLIDRVLADLRCRVPVIAADVSGRQSNLLRFKDADLLCPTEREVRETLHDFTNSLPATVWNLLHATQARGAIVTLGKQGLITFDKNSASAAGTNPDDIRLRSEYIPALSRFAIDPLGCGDALLATATLTLAAGGSLTSAAFLGSLAAAAHAQLLGNAPLSTDRLLDRLQSLEPLSPVRKSA